MLGDRTDAVSPGGAIDIDADGHIAAVGTTRELGATTTPERRVGGLLMPGLINGHAHGPMTLIRSAGDARRSCAG